MVAGVLWFLFFFATWFLAVVAGAMAVDKQGNTSYAPALPVLPICFWLLLVGLDWAHPRLGWYLVGIPHLLIFLFSLGFMAFRAVRLRRERRTKSP
jgi:hypothetical protein